MLRSNVLIPGSILLAVLALAPDPGVGQTPPASPPSPQTPQAPPSPAQPQAQQPQAPQPEAAQTPAPSQETTVAEGTPDPKAAEVAARVLQALGGKEAWDSTRYLRFTFGGRRRHYWDKRTSRHRLEGQTPQAQNFVVLSDLNMRQGISYLDGQEATGDIAKQMVDGTYAAWINDSNWLLLPYKLLDPGVQLAYDGTEQIDGKTYDKLQVTIPGSADHYTAYINQQTSLLDRWTIIPPKQAADTQPVQWLWEGWQKYGKIMLAPTRTQVGGDGKIEFTDLAVLDQLSDMVFDSPAVPANP